MNIIEELSPSNYHEIARFALDLWPDSSLKEEEEHFLKCMQDASQTAFILRESTTAVGFISVSLRSEYVEGARSRPVCYLEGIYLDPGFRKKGFARMLVEKAEAWGKQRQCTEMASDAELGNAASIEFHRYLGFKEVNRVVCFIKDIS